MFQMVNGIPVWGEHEAGTIEQIRRIASDREAVAAALMADGHLGYSMPIGGVVAYREAVSPSGVGYDISCLAAGTPVTTIDGCWLPIEAIGDGYPISCWDGEAARQASPVFGAITRGIRPVVHIQLVNQRTIVATRDHQVLTQAGWKPVGQLVRGDELACRVFLGLRYELPRHSIPIMLRRPKLTLELEEHGILPLVPGNPLLPVILRLLGYLSGDGHLSLDGKYLALYTTSETDAAMIARDITRLGYTPRIYWRSRHPRRRAEISIRVNSIALHALFESLGSPIGKKEWPAEPMPWLFLQPAWLRAQFLSAFCSAEMMTPRLLRNRVVSLQLKQAGQNRHAIDFVARVFQSLAYDVSVAPSGPPRGERQDYVLQILGGDAAQVRFFSEIGFCYAAEKQQRAAESASIFWQRAAIVRKRTAARDKAHALGAAGMRRKEVVTTITQEFAVSPYYAIHALYSGRGELRCTDMQLAQRTTGELCWVPVETIESAGETIVYDIVTTDPAQSFFAQGVVVHNCGIKGVRTTIRAADIRRDIARIMDDIARTVVFGVGQTSGKAADHPLFDDPTWHDLPEVGKLRQMAREQLGTVGSGNHWVDILEDEAGWIWVGAHFGSRGLGHRTASGFLNLATGRRFDDHAPGESMQQPATLLSMRTDLGQAYWQAMTLAGKYAYAGRDFVVQQVLTILGAQATEEVHNHHNYAWIERIDGEDLIVVRKGATPAWPGQRGFVGGSMGDISVVVEGVATEEARLGLHSTIHGAGRVMSRTQAAGKRRWTRRNGRRVQEVVKPGKISREMMLDWLRREQVELRGGGADESPHVYRRLPEVLQHHTGSIKIVHTLKPLGVAMAGEDVFDPYKD